MSTPTKQQLESDRKSSCVPGLVEAIEKTIYRLETYIEAEREMTIDSMEVCLINLRTNLNKYKGGQA